MTNGMDDFATNGELRQALRKDFPAHQITKITKAKGRPPVDTVSHALVTDRLNSTAPSWTIGEPIFIEMEEGGARHCLAVVNWMSIGSVTRWEIGEPQRLSRFGQEAKEAMSDFIKRGAMRFGVGIGLRGDLLDDEALEVADAVSTSPGVASAGPDPEVKQKPDPVGPYTDTSAEQLVASAEGGTSGSGPPSGEPSSEAQWERLVAVCGGSTSKALNRLNRVNKTSYTQVTAVHATFAELSAAITGEVA